MRHFFAAILAAGSIGLAAHADGPELIGVEKIWDGAPHNAFPDLIRWHDRFYCVFREAANHVRGDGVIRIISSTDGHSWESAAALSETGIDLRDPKLSITPDDRLMIVLGGSRYDGGTVLKEMQPRVAFSIDGRTWTTPQRVLTTGEWLWRVTWHNGKAYGVAYSVPKDSEWLVKLFRSDDGIQYDLVTQLQVPGRPNETTLRFLPDGRMLALMRRDAAGDNVAWIGASQEPYREWQWRPTKYAVGGPNFIQVPSGELWAAGRSSTGPPKTALARMTAESYEPALTLPSGGDCSYPGLLWHDGLLWMSYYSSHEGKASIYLARIRLPKSD